MVWVDVMIPRLTIPTTQVKHADFYAAITIVLQMGLGRITTIKTVETRDKNFLPQNDRDVGMKKVQKQDIIQNGTIIIWNSIPIPTFHKLAII